MWRQGWFFQASATAGKQILLEQLPREDARDLSRGAFNIVYPPGYEARAPLLAPPPAHLFDQTVEQIEHQAMRTVCCAALPMCAAQARRDGISHPHLEQCAVALAADALPCSESRLPHLAKIAP